VSLTVDDTILVCNIKTVIFRPKILGAIIQNLVTSVNRPLRYVHPWACRF